MRQQVKMRQKGRERKREGEVSGWQLKEEREDSKAYEGTVVTIPIKIVKFKAIRPQEEERFLHI